MLLIRPNETQVRLISETCDLPGLMGSVVLSPYGATMTEHKSI